ncbi:MAG: MFS transporter [Verrucomicrobia bacterium]|nr:MFS transporter [Verrucomicrobiota bacterium]HCL91575.1 MFS transporter [Limisphaerales bacterium]HRY57730.1 MFS transporter [Candidatus Paceibacterota bacterium]HNR71597.1 MFS transporter [Verrucomicrobiota bacterium]HOS75591.1 MFS transporter [Verrucomicrobiota bacterium]
MYNRNLVFAAACLGMLLFGIVFLSLGSAMNMLAERFQFDNNSIGTLTALLPFGILAGSLIFGPIVDRFGYRWMLIVCSLLVMAGLEGMAFGHREGHIQFFIFLIGLGGGVLNGATNALAADVSEGARGARLSLLGVFYGIGALGMPSTLAALSRHFSLAGIIAGIGVFVLVPVVYFLVIPFPPPKQQARSGALSSGLALLRHPFFLLAGLALAIQSGMEGMTNDWITRYFKHVTLAGRPAEEWRTLLGLMVVTGAMVLMRIVLSGLLQYTRSPRVLFVSIGITAAGGLLLLFAGGYGAALAAAALIGAGLAAAFPVVLGYIGDRYPAQSGTAFSAIFFIALIGNMTINKSFGFLAQSHGIQQYPKVMLGCLLASLILLSLVVKQLPGRTAPAAAPETIPS